MVSTSACRAEDPDSVPGGGVCTDCTAAVCTAAVGTASAHRRSAAFYISSKRAHPDLNQGPADLQAAALTTELCTQMTLTTASFHHKSTAII